VGGLRQLFSGIGVLKGHKHSLFQSTNSYRDGENFQNNTPRKFYNVFIFIKVDALIPSFMVAICL
jgi:hypothetical protein